LKLDRPGKRLFGGVTFSAAQLELAETRVRAAPIGIDSQRVFNLGDGAVEILQAGERLRDQDLPIDVSGVFREHLFRAPLRVVESTCEKEKPARLQLQRDVVRAQIGGSNVFAQCLRELSGLKEGFTQLRAHICLETPGSRRQADRQIAIIAADERAERFVIKDGRILTSGNRSNDRSKPPIAPTQAASGSE
jgi:hypothetical protein